MKTAVTIGNFDGVHRGHRSLIESILKWRRQYMESTGQMAKAIVLTFDPHPVEVLKNVQVPRLSSMAEKTRLLLALGVDEVRVLPFTKEFAQTSAKDFFEQTLVKDLNAGFVAIGHNFNFGKNREGTPGKFIDWCGAAGIDCQMLSGVEADGALVSSSRIRALIEAGQMIAASRLLGRDYSIRGEVVHGDKRGRLLGFPTANVIPSQLNTPCLPAKGVYLSFSTLNGGTFPSITNVGVKPTVSNNGQLVIETHILDFSQDVYGSLLSVEFRDRLREERKFSGLDELKQQIHIDTQTARSRMGLV